MVLSKKLPFGLSSSAFKFQEDSRRGEEALREEPREVVRLFSIFVEYIYVRVFLRL